MTEFDPQNKAEHLAKAEAWFSEVRHGLEAEAGFPYLEPEDDRFLEQLKRGMELSESRIAMYAKLLDRRETYREETGADIITEQFYVLKIFLPKSQNRR